MLGLEDGGELLAQFWRHAVAGVLEGFAEVVALGSAAPDVADRAAPAQGGLRVGVAVVAIHEGGLGRRGPRQEGEARRGRGQREAEEEGGELHSLLQKPDSKKAYVPERAKPSRP